MSSGEPPVSVPQSVNISRTCVSEMLESDGSFNAFPTGTSDIATGGSLDDHDVVTREVERKLELSLDDLIEMGKQQLQSENMDEVNPSKPRSNSSNRHRVRVPGQIRRGSSSFRPALWPSRNYHPAGELLSVRPQPYGLPPAPRSLVAYGGSPGMRVQTNFAGGRFIGEPTGRYNIAMEPYGYSSVEAIGPPPFEEWYAPMPVRAYGPRRGPIVATSGRVDASPYPPAYFNGRYRQALFQEEPHQYAVPGGEKQFRVNVGPPVLQSGYHQTSNENGSALTPDDLEEIRQAARERAMPTAVKSFRNNTGKSRSSFDLVAAAEESALLDVEISYPVPTSAPLVAEATVMNGDAGTASSSPGSQASALSLVVTFKGTDVIKVDKNSGELTLDSGGWRTLSTKLVINNALKPLGIWIEEDPTPNSRGHCSPTTKNVTGEGSQASADVIMATEDCGQATEAGKSSGAGDSGASVAAGSVISGGTVTAVGSATGSAATRTQSLPNKNGSGWVVADGRSFLQVFSDGMVIGRVGAATRMQMLARASVVAQHLKQMKSNAVTRRHRNCGAQSAMRGHR